MHHDQIQEKNKKRADSSHAMESDCKYCRDSRCVLIPRVVQPTFFTYLFVVYRRKKERRIISQHVWKTFVWFHVHLCRYETQRTLLPAYNKRTRYFTSPLIGSQGAREAENTTLWGVRILMFCGGGRTIKMVCWPKNFFGGSACH